MSGKHHFKIAVKLAVVFLVTALAAGCVSNGSKQFKRVALPFETIKKGNYGFGFIEGRDTPDYVVIKSADKWQSYWNKAEKESIFSAGGDRPFIDPDPYSDQMEPVIPDVNFERQMVIGVVLEEPSSGYDLEITKVIQEPDKVLVQAKINVSDPGGFENTAPYQFVKVDGNPDLPVKFDITQKNNS